MQAALAEHLCEVAAGSQSSRIVIETHSEHLLLGVQLQIVLGLLRPEDVQVYWVHQIDGGQSIANPAFFDEDARPQGVWPPGIFSEDIDLARAIIEARQGRVKARSGSGTSPEPS